MSSWPWRTTPVPPPRPVPPPLRTILVLVAGPDGVPVAGATVYVDDLPQGHIGPTNDDGQVSFLVSTLPQSFITVAAEGFLTYSQHLSLPRGNLQVRIGVPADPSRLQDVILPGLTPVRPPAPSLEELARIRGAMWTQRLNLPMGPYPGQDYNINAMDYYEWYGADDRKRMIDKTLTGGYTHAVTGPIYDEGGYHGRWPAQTEISQRVWDAYLDCMEEWRDAGVTPVHFAKPDNWTLPDVQQRLEPFYRQPRAQALLPILVPGGWEPTRYGWSTRTWARFADWAAEVNPQALILAHSVEDVDALKGTDALYDDEHDTNGQSWQYVAPHYHGWFLQLGGYVHLDVNDPQRAAKIAQWKLNLAAYFRDMADRFERGKNGWPTESRWGPTVPLKRYYGEGGSLAFFNNPSISEAEVREFGDIAVANGAAGYLDGGSVDVP